MRDVSLTLTIYNNAGGAMTAYAHPSYHLNAVLSTVDGNITVLTVKWDADAAVWREVSRVIST